MLTAPEIVLRLASATDEEIGRLRERQNLGFLKMQSVSPLDHGLLQAGRGCR